MSACLHAHCLPTSLLLATTSGQLLSAACMLELLTLLPQECEDAVAAAQVGHSGLTASM